MGEEEDERKLQSTKRSTGVCLCVRDASIPESQEKDKLCQERVYPASEKGKEGEKITAGNCTSKEGRETTPSKRR